MAASKGEPENSKEEHKAASKEEEATKFLNLNGAPAQATESRSDRKHILEKEESKEKQPEEPKAMATLTLKPEGLRT